MKLSDLAEIAANLIYKFMPSNEIVFDYGDDGDKFYIVLDGVCDILVPVLIKDDHPLTETEKKAKRNTLMALDTMNEKRVEVARHIS
jgi:hypothetical protein